MAPAPYPLNSGITMAPTFAQARNTATVSGIIGRQSPTQSPGPTPSSRRPLAQRAVSAASSR